MFTTETEPWSTVPAVLERPRDALSDPDLPAAARLEFAATTTDLTPSLRPSPWRRRDDQ